VLPDAVLEPDPVDRSVEMPDSRPGADLGLVLSLNTRARLRLGESLKRTWA